VEEAEAAGRFPCACCGYFTLPEAPSGTYFICPVCFWEDDPLQFDDSAYEGGANVISLDEARRNYAEFGASERRFLSLVRQPKAAEAPANGTR
jgi:hypothetical protein